MDMSAQPGISPEQRFIVLGALVDRRRDGKAFVKAKYLAETTGLESRTIGRVFAHLREDGYLAPYRETSGRSTVWEMVGPLADIRQRGDDSAAPITAPGIAGVLEKMDVDEFDRRVAKARARKREDGPEQHALDEFEGLD